MLKLTAMFFRYILYILRSIKCVTFPKLFLLIYFGSFSDYQLLLVAFSHTLAPSHEFNTCICSCLIYMYYTCNCKPRVQYIHLFMFNLCVQCIIHVHITVLSLPIAYMHPFMYMYMFTQISLFIMEGLSWYNDGSVMNE